MFQPTELQMDVLVIGGGIGGCRQRPNAIGPRGALTLYGQPQRPEFQWERT